MENEVSMSLRIILELSLTAILVGVAVSFGYLSRIGLSGIDNINETSKYMQARSELYEYNNRVVTGSSVIECISDNLGMYDFIVYSGDINNPNSVSNAVITKSGLDLNTWTYKKLAYCIDQNASYLATLIFLNDNNEDKEEVPAYNNSYKEEIPTADGVITKVSTPGRVISGVLFEKIGG